MTDARPVARARAGVQVGELIRTRKAADLISAHIRKQIVTGQLQTGQMLPPEVELMSQYGVSRPTLREALRILESELLINVRRGAHGGAHVMAPDVAVAARYVGLVLQFEGTTIGDVYEARIAAEPYCARLLAKCRTEQDLDDLRASILTLRELVRPDHDSGPDWDRWAEVSYHFHELVVERCGNRTLAVQAAVLTEIVRTHLRVSMKAVVENDVELSTFRKSLSSFNKLVRLLENRDADGAEAHWRQHMIVSSSVSLGNEAAQPVIDLFV
jgi:DNA-binding FadR family transcriptional regulator